jgi:hypothetical protein
VDVTLYPEIVKRILRQYDATPPAVGDIRSELIFDDDIGHYELMVSGWLPGQQRVHGPILHLDVRDGKVWIEHDGTSPGIALDLMEAGIPKSDIVLAFHPPQERPFTGFAVGTAITSNVND